jgi:predicted nucleic-acid-binding protein
MTGIDTNVLVRYFLDDDPAQASRIEVFMRECRKKGEGIFVSSILLSHGRGYRPVRSLENAMGPA